MTLGVHPTLRIAPADPGVLSAAIDAPPMNLIGPEVVRDYLVRLFGELEPAMTSGSWCWKAPGPWPGSRCPPGLHCGRWNRVLAAGQDRIDS